MRMMVFGGATWDLFSASDLTPEGNPRAIISGGGGRVAIAASHTQGAEVLLVASCAQGASQANDAALYMLGQHGVAVRSVEGAQMSVSLFENEYKQVPSATLNGASVILDAEQAIAGERWDNNAAVFIGGMAIFGVHDMTRAAKKVADAGTPVILDLNCRQPLTNFDKRKGISIVNTWAQHAHIIKIGEVDLPFYDDGSWAADENKAEKSARRFLDIEGSTTKLVVVTYHAKPAVAYWKENGALKQLEIPTTAVANVPENKVGAGDAFDAGLAVTLGNHGITLEQIQNGLTEEQIRGLVEGAHNTAGRTLNLYYNNPKDALLPGEIQFTGSPMDFVVEFAGLHGARDNAILLKVQESYLALTVAQELSAQAESRNRETFSAAGAMGAIRIQEGITPGKGKEGSAIQVEILDEHEALRYS